MNIGGLKRGRLIAGQRGMGGSISWVDVLEIPNVEQWIRPGVFMVSSLYAFRDSPGSLPLLIRVLKRKGSAGLAVFTGECFISIPEAAMTAANEEGFPLFELPPDLGHMDVVGPLMEALLNRHFMVLRRADELRRHLMDMFLVGTDFKRVLRSFANSMGAVVAFIGEEDDDLILAMPASRTRSWHAFWKAHGETRIHSLRGFTPSVTSFKGDGEGEAPVEEVVVPVLVRGHPRAALVSYSLGGPHEPWQLLALEHAAVVAALDLIRMLTIQEAEEGLKRDLLEEVFQRAFHSEDELLPRADGLKLELRDKKVVIVLDPCLPVQASANGRDRVTPLPDQESFDRAVRRVGARLRQMSPASYLMVRNSQVVVLVAQPRGGQSDDGKTLEHASDLADTLRTTMSTEMDGRAVSAGVGDPQASILELADSYHSACKAANIGKWLFGDGRTVRYADLGVYRFLADRTAGELRREYDRVLRKVQDSDAREGSDLIRTLEAVFECGGNTKEAATSLSIHENTVRYRLKKVAAILGYDPWRGPGRFEVEICLRIGRLLGMTGH
ncbi:MAG: PucR family transcriptional regulator [Ignavibacteriales bacterium]